ncbi:MAG: 50S ribosomal protein L6 [Bacteroidetes bacterium]|jgi:large subunit ribosomal protein L6|nr:50S ribosomal protein L6 [Bacteroidota bacterium]MBT5527905.1 50S ribosomal protein L6 [Cytophagia bacterium]MBT3424922.1 50S ribosomal protein L6 [Bacteroidota bacterium]MBT3933960.1 50S ribosomal protein L6 [Bacteroidota bacterium]MBT4338243.1 50S ribosomal protein L6 [Bacteroidota bacterium]
MSRIGKMPIAIPDKVQVDITKGNLVSVKGPKGEMQRQIDTEMILKIEDNTIFVDRPTEQKRHKAMHGLSRTLVGNMVEGVSNGFKIQQELIGVGYKVSNQGQRLELSLGFSHDVIFVIPDEVKVETETVKGKSPVIRLESCDKELLGLIAAKIRALRKPEPYKGKGIKYTGEEIRRKAGKTAAA